jgi:hypothetical protein
MDPVSLIAGAIGGIFQTLPSIGVGSKSRQKEIDKATSAQLSILDKQTQLSAEQAKKNTKILVVAGVLVMVIVIIIITLKRK